MEVGKLNTLRVLRDTSVGMYLGDEAGNDVLLPNKYIPEDLNIGDDIEVFLYQDSEDRLIATTLTPKIKLGEFALMNVRDVNHIGAFMDWGLEKDLLVPFREQGREIEFGERHVIHLYLDAESNRLVGSSKIPQFLDNEDHDLEEGQEVDVFVFRETDLGFKVIINDEFEGLIYRNEVFKDVKVGTKTKGFVKYVRDDDKIDISLQKQGYVNVIDDVSQSILDKLKENNGFLPYHDKSDPEDIKEAFSLSKKNFKKAIGNLYKDKIIKIESNGITLL